jgi:hypothetical protein
MDTFRISELQELEEEFLPEGTEFYSGPDTEEPLTDDQMARLEAAYRGDTRIQTVRRSTQAESVGYDDESEDDEYRGVRPLDFA